MKKSIGIIGCGKIAQVRHIPELAGHPQAEIAGYYNPTLSRAEEMARKMIADGDIGRVLTFSPSIKGTSRWLSPRLIEFIPETGSLKNGQAYTGRFALDKVHKVSSRKFKKFEFSFLVAIKEAVLSGDDACAIRILHRMEKDGFCKVEGICISAVRPESGPSMRAFLASEDWNSPMIFADLEAADYDGTPCYHQLLTGLSPHPVREDLQDCVEGYRSLLVRTKGKTDIIAVGYPNALVRLLESQPDSISPLTGRELVRKKVARLWMMAGEYPSGKENNFKRTERSRKAGHIICREWPTEIIFLGYEIGIQVKTGGNLPEEDLLHSILQTHGSGNGRFAWDPLTVVLALSKAPEKAGFRLHWGHNHVDAATGANTFTPSSNGPHAYVTLTKEPAWHASVLDSLLTAN